MVKSGSSVFQVRSASHRGSGQNPSSASFSIATELIVGEIGTCSLGKKLILLGRKSQ